MQAFDASSMLYAWDNYPIEQFPRLWMWVADQLKQGQLRMSEVALVEVSHKYPACCNWLKHQGIQKLPVTEAIMKEALLMKDLLGIVGEKYGAGVDENDLIIIATAKINHCELVTDEAFQPSLNKLKPNWKIPAVCNMESMGVPWLGFLAYLKRSQEVFG